MFSLQRSVLKQTNVPFNVRKVLLDARGRFCQSKKPAEAMTALAGFSHKG